MKKLYSLQRFKLAAVTFITAYIFLGLLFGFADWYLVNRSYQYTMSNLKKATQSGLNELIERPKSPEIDEVLDGFPEVSIAAFDLKRHLIKRQGSVHIKNFSPVIGKSLIDGNKVMLYSGFSDKVGFIEAAISWESKEKSNHYLIAIFFSLLFPLSLAAALITFFASKWTFLPLKDLSQQAESLSTHDLKGRLNYLGQDEFAEFADRLNRFLDRIESSVSQQEQFVADAAHELRTPLTIIRGQIETALLRPRSAPDYQEHLHIVLKEAERLSSLVELLLISATTSEGVNSPINISEVIDSVVHKWESRFRKQAIKIVTEGPEISTKILEEELTSVLDNLFSNSLRFAPEKSNIWIRTSYETGSMGKWSVIDFIDEGPGVPIELKDKVFDRFTRGETSRNRELGGFGIGLAVCKRLILLRGGTIELMNESVEGSVGAHFRIKLPFSELAEPLQAFLIPATDPVGKQ